jgi:hypothetical protein
MAKNSITDYDNISGNNTDVQSVDISEGCSPSGINNAIREVMADLADVNDGTVALTSPQAANMTVTGTVTTDTIAENTSAAGVTIDGVLLKDGGVDVNGNELILDADGDTSITADTDDQIDFKTGGSDRMVIDSSGNVGIGTTSPVSSVNIVDTASTANVRLESGSGTPVILQNFASTAAGGAYIDVNSNHPLLFRTNATERMRIDNSGNLLVGTTSTFGGLAGITTASNFVVGSSSQYWKTTNFSSTYYFNFNGSDKATINGSTGAYTALSDRNKKKDFEESTLGLSEVLRLQPTMFRMSSDDASAPLELGFIAQDVADVIPQAYVEQEAPDGAFIGLQDRPIIAVLTKAIQEQQATIQELEARIAALESA